MFWIGIILIIGLAGILGNQQVGLRKMESLQKSLEEIERKLER
ncbi:hypothetical protein AB9M62_48930 [Bacillales bacterium AN1005]